MWADIDEFKGIYQISICGAVRRISGRIMGTGILKPHLRSDGYMFYNLTTEEKTFNRAVHRLLAIAFLHNPENKKEINHKNGIKTDFRIENLEWVTRSENIRHAFETRLLKSRTDKRGAYLRSSSKKGNSWIAAIGQKKLGTFNSKEEAHKAFYIAFKEKHGFAPWAGE